MKISVCSLLVLATLNVDLALAAGRRYPARVTAGEAGGATQPQGPGAALTIGRGPLSQWIVHQALSDLGLGSLENRSLEIHPDGRVRVLTGGFDRQLRSGNDIVQLRDALKR